MTTNDISFSGPNRTFQALLWKSWRESRVRFICSLVLLIALVTYFVLTSSDFLSGYAVQHPNEPLAYTGYIWKSLFDYFFQGFWIAAAFVLGLGGLVREKAAGEALYTLGLPVSRTRTLLIRSFVASIESMFLALLPALLIPILSYMVGRFYPWQQALGLALLLCIAGMVFVGTGVLLSAIFEGELTAPIVGLCAISIVFFAVKAKSLHRWSIFDVMNGAKYIDPYTHLLQGTGPWVGLCACLAIAGLLFWFADLAVCAKDF